MLILASGLIGIGQGSAAAATTESITGTATIVGGDGISATEWTYSSPGVLGSGKMHSDFTLTPTDTGANLAGVTVLTRSDGATLSGPTTATIVVTLPQPPNIASVDGHFILRSGTGDFAGATGEIVYTGTSKGPGSAENEVFAMTGTINTGSTGAKLASTGMSRVPLYLGLAMLTTGVYLVALSRRQRLSTQES